MSRRTAVQGLVYILRDRRPGRPDSSFHPPTPEVDRPVTGNERDREIDTGHVQCAYGGPSTPESPKKEYQFF